MNDNDVIKALEMCGNIVVSSCKECSFHISCNANCVKQVMCNALDLINRQKADLKQKDTEIDILIRKREALKDEVAELRAEVERLKNECFCLSNERDAYKDVLDTAVSEARKELANLIERRLNSNTPRGAYLINIVDEVLTELTEQ